MSVWPVYMSMYHMHAMPEEARREPTLRLELQMVLNHYVGAGN